MSKPVKSYKSRISLLPLVSVRSLIQERSIWSAPTPVANLVDIASSACVIVAASLLVIVLVIVAERVSLGFSSAVRVDICESFRSLR